ncbi:peptidoglycan-binding protein LysM, partial [Klebsiella oxytoca]
PGLVGFIADKEGSLWDIAKEYNTTVENIMQLNQLDTDRVRPGDKLLLFKQIDGI